MRTYIGPESPEPKEMLPARTARNYIKELLMYVTGYAGPFGDTGKFIDHMDPRSENRIRVLYEAASFSIDMGFHLDEERKRDMKREAISILRRYATSREDSGYLFRELADLDSVFVTD